MLVETEVVSGDGAAVAVRRYGDTRPRDDCDGPRSSHLPLPLISSIASASPSAPIPRTERTQAFGASVDALYLFGCSLRWHQEREASAGWELVHSLRTGDRDTRALAAALLAKTEDARLLVRDLRRVGRDSKQLLPDGLGRSAARDANEVDGMRTPYGLEIIESCLTCKLRKENWFCRLSPEGLRLLGAASHLNTYPGGALLFVEGQAPRGAFVLCSGKAKLFTTSREGKVLILKIAEAGEVLGLSAVISGEPFELTAADGRTLSGELRGTRCSVALDRAERRSRTSLFAGFEPGVPIGVSGHPRFGAGSLLGGQAGPITAVLDAGSGKSQ